jgi:hypothetical protein
MRQKLVLKQEELELFQKLFSKIDNSKTSTTRLMIDKKFLTKQNQHLETFEWKIGVKNDRTRYI